MLYYGVVHMIWYDNDMIYVWYDMIWYDTIWYDMIYVWYDMIWYANDIWCVMMYEWYDMNDMCMKRFSLKLMQCNILWYWTASADSYSATLVLFLCVFLFPPHFLFLPVSLFISDSLCLCLSVWFTHSVSVSFAVSVCLFICLSPQWTLTGKGEAVIFCGVNVERLAKD